MKPAVGVVGVTEKGTTSVELRVDGRGGHASTPAKNGPTARLARAILRVDRSPMSASLPDPTVELMRRLAPHAPLPLRPLMSGAERLRPLLTRALIAAGPESAAMTRTTFATTTLHGSPALNVIASTARAGINIRVMVGDTVADVITHLRKVINDDQVAIEVVEEGEPSPVSPVDDDAFRLIESTIVEVFPDAVPAPYVMMAATDSRHFTRDLPAGLPVRALPDDQGATPGDPLLRRAPRCRRLPLGHPVVPAPDREDPAMTLIGHHGTEPTPEPRVGAHGLVAIVGFLVCVELASGVLQGYYTPIFSDIADHLDISDADVNWFEAAQLIVAALCVPLLARLGDLIGAKNVLLHLHRRHRARLVGAGLRAVVHDVPHRLGHPGCLRDLAAHGGRHRLQAHGRHRPPEPAHPPGGRHPGRRARAGGHHRRPDQRGHRRVDLDDRGADAAGHRGDGRASS